MAEKSGNSSLTKLIILIVILSVLSVLAGLYVDWLWFDSIDFGKVFTVVLVNRVGLYVLFFVLTLVLFYLNLRMAARNAGTDDRPEETDEGREIIYLHPERTPWQMFMQGKYSRWIFLGVSVVAALLVSSVAADNWITVQQFLHRVTAGTSDPIFHKDISFYFFNLAFYHFIYDSLMLLLVLLTVVMGILYLFNASTDLLTGDWREFTFAKRHIAILLALIFALKGLGYWLAQYDILFSPAGIVYGATYTDIHGRLLAYKALMVISLIVAVVVLANVFVRRLRWVLMGIGAWVVLALVLNGIYPAALQNLVVKPNEFNKERPYIENAIQFTRQAYALDRVHNRDFNIDYDLDISSPSNQDTVNNIRLWDWQPITTTYQNLQQLRPYYVFNDVDIDRYVVDGRYRQLMLSTRELDQGELPEDAQTWINQRLMYTHGYGMVVSPVTEVAEEGFPEFFVKDVPPRFSTNLKVTRPEIYFGERTAPYVFVDTNQKEFDYPMGTTNMYTKFQGETGIKVGSFGRRLVLAWVLKDYKVLLSSDVTSNSQLLINRNIKQRVNKIAPYLQLDDDPYIVINNQGKLYWILDAYTYTDKYPYSKPFDSFRHNYLRNAVKVTCVAYSGEMNFYVADASDPLIKSYSRIFPGLYRPLAEMPEDLRAHIRYPVDYYSVQAEMYKTFHMTDPYVFYNKEDLWLLPREVVGVEKKLQNMDPYYLLMRLPDEEKTEYILMLPFTPKGRPNMIAWMCARMDGDNYGRLLVYNFPKQETIYGPEQVESRINQDTEISQQLSLWDQRGSRVYRGNLLVIPMDNSILYIEPLYLQAENSRLPELKRVIAGFGNRVVMEPTLDLALNRLFGEESRPPGQDQVTTGAEPPEAETENVAELSRQARQYYDRANELLRQGDWAGYGQNIRKLDQVISRLEKAAAK